MRLGLLLSEIGAANGVEVSSQEMNRLIGQAAAQYQPEDRERFIQYVQQDPMAAAQLRAPLYEDKVVDFLFSKAEISERASTRAELEATSRARKAMSTARAAATTCRPAEAGGKKARQAAKPAGQGCEAGQGQGGQGRSQRPAKAEGRPRPSRREASP